MEAQMGVSYRTFARTVSTYLHTLAEIAERLYMYRNPASRADVADFQRHLETTLVAVDTSGTPVQRSRIIPQLQKVLWSAKHKRWGCKFQVAVDGSGMCSNSSKLVLGASIIS